MLKFKARTWLNIHLIYGHYLSGKRLLREHYHSFLPYCYFLFSVRFIILSIFMRKFYKAEKLLVGRRPLIFIGKY